MKFAYIRVSTREQSLEMQKNALKSYDCDREYEDDGISGKTMDRPGLISMLDQLRTGDEVYVYSLSRLGRNTLEIIALVENWNKRDIKLISHTEQIDCRSPMGRMFLGIIALMAQLERELTEERRIQGIKTARENGVKFGRKTVLTPEQTSFILASPNVTIREWMERYNVSRSTICRVKRVSK